MKLAEYGKLNELRLLYSVNSIQATLERKLSDIIKSAFLRTEKNVILAQVLPLEMASWIK